MGQTLPDTLNKPLTPRHNSDMICGSSSDAPDIPLWLRDYLMRRRQALLMEVAEIEKMLNLALPKARVNDL